MADETPHATVLDSDEQQVGALYAKALLGAAGDDVDAIVAQLEAIVRECLDPHPSLERFLVSPRIDQQDKEDTLDRIFSGRVHGSLLNFLKVLCRRGRIGSLRTIQAAATEQREIQLGKQRVVVTSAQPLTDGQKHEIAEALRAQLNVEPVLIEKVDASLLGGIQLRIGDRVLDGSVIGRMNAIRAGVTEGVQKAIRDQFETLLSN